MDKSGIAARGECGAISCHDVRSHSYLDRVGAELPFDSLNDGKRKQQNTRQLKICFAAYGKIVHATHGTAPSRKPSRKRLEQVTMSTVHQPLTPTHDSTSKGLPKTQQQKFHL